MPRFAFQLSYLGTGYHGWQWQNNAISVQEVLTKALSTTTQEEIELVGCGRTDTGVHARNYILHVDLQTKTDHLITRWNSLLPDDISIDHAFEVPTDFHARFDALERAYVYRITKVKNPFEGQLMLHDRRNYDVDLMNKGCEMIHRTSEFGAFCKLHSENKTNRCDVRHAEWSLLDNELRFEVRADRFLRNMVRAMVGTLLDLGIGKITLDNLEAILDSQDRSAAGRSVPAQGLMLTDVVYDRTYWKEIKEIN